MAFLKLTFLAFTIALACGGIIQDRKTREFETFLKNSVNGKYQEPLTPELEKLQNYWERSGKFEGDIVLTEDQIKHLVQEFSGARNSILNSARYWTNNTVYYTIDESYFDEDQINAIEAGVRDMEELSCLTFRKRENETNYVVVTGMIAGCYSSVGMIGGPQTLNLQVNVPGTGCFRHGTIVHEFLHAVGFYHMQSTHNRDDWVEIVWDKIIAGTENNFNKYNETQVTNFDVDYDYGSVLHYTEYGFSIDGNKTMVALQATNETIGQRIGMSYGDIRKLNLLYGCISLE